jgi:hypothetical protein
VHRPVRTAAAVLAALALAGAAGCGGGDEQPAAPPPPSPQEQVRATWQQAVDAALDGDGAAFCALATPAARAELTERTQLPCPDAIRLLQVRLTDRDRAVVRAAEPQVTVTGDRAVVRYESTPSLEELGFTGRTRLERVAGAWRLQGI